MPWRSKATSDFESLYVVCFPSLKLLLMSLLFIIHKSLENWMKNEQDLGSGEVEPVNLLLTPYLIHCLSKSQIFTKITIWDFMNEKKNIHTNVQPACNNTSLLWPWTYLLVAAINTKPCITFTELNNCPSYTVFDFFQFLQSWLKSIINRKWSSRITHFVNQDWVR